MTSRPEELIFFEAMTSERFFEEAELLGVTSDDLTDEETHNFVFNSCLINLRTDTALDVAEELGIEITEEQARAIAVNSLVPQVIAEPAPLSPDERKIAKELYFHAIKAAVRCQRGKITDRVARADAARMVRAGERGMTKMYKWFNASGCLVVLVLLTLGTAMASISFAAVIK